MDKAPDAFRTISEVADVLETPAHVLRFWESRFPQIRPIKRAGGRRYYRPGDVALLAGIRLLLHDQGLTIRGVQKVLRENGVRHVQALAHDKLDGVVDPGEAAEIEAHLNRSFLIDVEPEAIIAPEGADIVALPTRKRASKAVERLRADAPPPANAASPAEEVPEAPFIEAEEAPPATADVLHLTNPGTSRRRAKTPDPAPDEDLPLLARMAEWERTDEELAAEDLAAEDLADLAALDGVGPGDPSWDTEDMIEAHATAEAAPETPATESPDLEATLAPHARQASLAHRLRALPRPVPPDTAAALAPLLARALDLQARLSAVRSGRD